MKQISTASTMALQPSAAVKLGRRRRRSVYRKPSSVLILTALLFSLMLPVDGAFGQDKNKKKGKTDKEQAVQDSLARAKYVFELNKNWSFGFENYKNKQYADVPRYFWKVVEMDTARKFPQVYGFLGQTFFELNQPDSAQVVYEKGIKIFPDDANLRRNLAYLLAAREQLDLALKEYETLLQQGAATEDDYRRMANLYVRTNQYEQAIKAYQEVLKLNPNDQEISNTLATLYKTTGNEEAALESMEKALAQNPNDTRIMFDLAQARFNRQEYEKAVELLERFSKQVPGDVFALELLGDAQDHLGRYREALKTYEQIIAAKPDNKKVLVKMSRCHRELGDFPTARRHGTRALAVDSKYGPAFIAIGKVYEVCADKCVAKKGKTDFDDKLVYKLAYEQYEKALQDLETRSEARQLLNFLEPSIPKTEDYFMNKGKTKAEGPCYAWIY
jgi:tetratricopeptide (TPR) repeat protein